MSLGLKAGDVVLLPAYHCGKEPQPFLHLDVRVRFYHINADCGPSEDLIRHMRAGRTIRPITRKTGMPDTLLPKIKDRETIRALAEVVETLLDRWGLARTEQQQLLAMENWAGAGEGSPLPADPAVLERFGQLLAISRTLEKLDPESPALGDWWLRTPQPAFAGQTPLAVMLSRGTEGMQAVRTILESG